MDPRRTPMDPDEAERRFAELLEQAGLPRFVATFHDPEFDELQFIWDHGLTLHQDLTRETWSRSTTGSGPRSSASAPRLRPARADPRLRRGRRRRPAHRHPIPGVEIHRGPPLASRRPHRRRRPPGHLAVADADRPGRDHDRRRAQGDLRPRAGDRSARPGGASRRARAGRVAPVACDARRGDRGVLRLRSAVGQPDLLSAYASHANVLRTSTLVQRSSCERASGGQHQPGAAADLGGDRPGQPALAACAGPGVQPRGVLGYIRAPRRGADHAPPRAQRIQIWRAPSANLQPCIEAIVQNTYGPPELPSLGEIDGLWSATTACSSAFMPLASTRGCGM